MYTSQVSNPQDCCASGKQGKSGKVREFRETGIARGKSGNRADRG